MSYDPCMYQHDHIDAWHIANGRMSTNWRDVFDRPEETVISRGHRELLPSRDGFTLAGSTTKIDDLSTSPRFTDDTRHMTPNDISGFNYHYALSYVHKALVGASTGRAPLDRPNKIIKTKTTKRKKSSSQSHISSLTFTVQDQRDIVQDAFVFYYSKPQRLRYVDGEFFWFGPTTKSSCAFAVGRYFQASTRQFKGETLATVNARLADYHRRYQHMYESASRIKGECDDIIYDTLVEWLSTGATQADVAKELGIKKQRISEMVRYLRKQEERERKLDDKIRNIKTYYQNHVESSHSVYDAGHCKSTLATSSHGRIADATSTPSVDADAYITCPCILADVCPDDYLSASYAI